VIAASNDTVTATINVGSGLVANVASSNVLVIANNTVAVTTSFAYGIFIGSPPPPAQPAPPSGTACNVVFDGTIHRQYHCVGEVRIACLLAPVRSPVMSPNRVVISC
jgi:hypothetical protein